MKVGGNRARGFAAIAFKGLILAIGNLSSPSIAAPCDALAGMKIDKTSIDAAESDLAGTYAPAGGPEVANLPPFCRVHGVT
jgi:hypothetical protein